MKKLALSDDILMKISKLTSLDFNISSYTNEEDGVIKFMLENVI